MPSLPSYAEVADTKKDTHQMIDNHTRELLGAAIDDFPPEKPYSICTDAVRVTVERLPYYPKPGDRLLDPGTARATLAPTNESPHGTTEGDWARKHQHQTVRVSLTNSKAMGFQPSQ